jgi:hypothetical protein
LAKGDQAKFINLTLAAGAFLEVRPAAGEVVFLKTIEHTGPIEVYMDATTTGPLQTHSASGIEKDINLYVDNSDYVSIKNTSASAIAVKAKGIQGS